ncbi:mitochondrial phosphate carrier protein [Cystobasidiomycetes sp. EMM_F5]
MFVAGRGIIAKEGAGALLTGFGPTAFGYLLQGGAKFAGYEFFKKTFVDAVGGYESAVPNRTAIYLGASATAEFFADILLTPCEATRIRLVSQRGYASGFLPAFARMAREGGLREFYAGFVPILAKQVPYAVGQFTVNEWAHEVALKMLAEDTKRNMGPIANGGLTLSCGVVAGVAAAIISQPGDTLLSQINKGEGGPGSATSKLIRLAREAGFSGLFVGLGPRIVMTAGLVSGQFVLYKYIKDALSSPPGIEIHKEVKSDSAIMLGRSIAQRTVRRLPKNGGFPAGRVVSKRLASTSSSGGSKSGGMNSMVVGAELLAGTVAVGYVMGWYGQQQQKDLPAEASTSSSTKSKKSAVETPKPIAKKAKEAAESTLLTATKSDATASSAKKSKSDSTTSDSASLPHQKGDKTHPPKSSDSDSLIASTDSSASSSAGPASTFEKNADSAAPSATVSNDEPEEDASQAAFNPETGEINWDCPCLGGMAHGPCGEQFKAAFSCFVYSQEEPKGQDCIEKFKDMQECFRAHPEAYGEADLVDEDEVEYDVVSAVEAALSQDSQ